MNVAFVFMNDTPIVGRGAGYMAGVIAAAGYPVSFFDSFYTPIEQIASQIVAGPADIVMISTMTMNFPLTLALIREIKKTKNLPVLAGGSHPTIEGPRLLEQYPEIDYLCIGEGESMVIDFLRYFSTNAFLIYKTSVTGKTERFFATRYARLKIFRPCRHSPGIFSGKSQLETAEGDFYT